MPLADGTAEVRLPELDGGPGCSAITRRFAVMHTSAGWWLGELSGHRVSRLEVKAEPPGAAAVVHGAQGPTQRCLARDAEAPQCSPVAPRGGRGSTRAP